MFSCGGVLSGAGQTREQPSAPRQTPAAATISPEMSKLLDQSSADSLRLSAGDLLEIKVFDVPELATESRVSGAGDIGMPLIGRVHLEGLTAQQAEREIEKRLRQGGFVREPQVSIFVKEYATQGASVLGEVSKPGIYPVLGSRRLFDLLSAASGLTDKAGQIVTITHREQPDKPVTVSLSRQPSRSTENNVEIRPGDTIVVSKSGVIYVVGDVGRPGGFIMDKNDNLTVLQAIALAEGTKSTASLDRSKLIRKGAQGVQVIPIPLKKILAARAPDVPLQAEEIVFVPGSASKGAMRRIAEAIIQVATGVVIYRR
jgi:polysaccharide export outer membrane protein